VDFSEARDLFRIIFQILGPNCKIMDCGLIFTNDRGLIANSLGFRIFPDLFCCRNSMDSVHGTMDHSRPRSTVDRPWTAAPGSPELRPLATPVSTGGGQGAGEEWNAGSSMGGSPGRRWQCGGRAS
jgi:hypothetical protein